MAAENVASADEAAQTTARNVAPHEAAWEQKERRAEAAATCEAAGRPRRRTLPPWTWPRSRPRGRSRTGECGPPPPQTRRPNVGSPEMFSALV